MASLAQSGALNSGQFPQNLVSSLVCLTGASSASTTAVSGSAGSFQVAPLSTVSHGVTQSNTAILDSGVSGVMQSDSGIVSASDSLVSFSVSPSAPSAL